MDIHLKLATLRDLSRDHPDLTLMLRDWTAYLLHEKTPRGLVMLTLEAHCPAEKSCEIVFLYARGAEHLGRREAYDRCIFSRHPDRLGQVVPIDEVKTRTGYLSLDPSVQSELFLEWPWRKDLHLIVNAELTTRRISLRAAGWFGGLTDLLPPREVGDA